MAMLIHRCCFLILLFALLPVATLSAQTDSSDFAAYIYRIKIDDCIHPPATRRQTGFQLAGTTGIITALHGVADCQTMSAVSDDGKRIFTDLTIAQVDIDHDVALLNASALSALPTTGLVVAPADLDLTQTKLRIVGYPLGLEKQDVDQIQSVRAVEALDDVIPDSEEPDAFIKRKSPRLDSEVLNLQAQLLPGHSGAPLLDPSHRLVAIGNGGLRSGTVNRSWAMPWYTITLQSVEQPAIARKLAELAAKAPAPALTFSSTFQAPASEEQTTTPYHVWVIDQRNKPIPNAEVMLTHSQGYEIGLTDSEGFYTFQLRSDANYSQSQLLVEVEGYQTVRRSVNNVLRKVGDEIISLPAVVHETAAMRGGFCDFAFRILDKSSELAIEGATIYVDLAGKSANGRSDSTGFYSSKLPCPDRYQASVQVRVLAEGYETHVESVALVGELKEIMLRANQPSEPEPAPGALPSTASIPTPVPCPTALNPYRLTPEAMQRFSCSAQEWVATRLIVTQQFADGFMIIFDDPSNNDFQTKGKQRKIYVLANDGRLWRVYFDTDDIRQNNSPNPDEWYTCDAQPGLRPVQSGVPWRGFGLVWCTYPQIRQALGRAVADEVKGVSSFQSYDRGRAFQIVGHTPIYLVYLDADEETIEDQYLTGAWRLHGEQVNGPPAVTAAVTSSDATFRVDLRIICSDTGGQVWFEGTVNRNGQPVNGYQIAFKSTKVAGTQPATPPAISGPHTGYTAWMPGYYAHIVDASASHAKSKSLQIWLMDSSGGRVSEDVYWETDGADGPCNKAVINFAAQ